VVRWLASFSFMNRTPDTWIADGYDVKQRGGRMIAYCGPHHTPDQEYPESCRLQDEANARWIAYAPARIAELEAQLRRYGIPVPVVANIGHEPHAPKKD